MLTYTVTPLIKKARILYNNNKLPTAQLSEEEASLIINTMYKYLKKYIEKPYMIEFRLEKFLRLKLRYAHLYKIHKNLIEEARYLKNKLSQIDLTEEERLKLEKKQEDNRSERRYYWVLMKKSMHEYRKTPKYRRLLKLREIWKTKGNLPIYKENIPLNDALINPGNIILGENKDNVYFKEI